MTNLHGAQNTVKSLKNIWRINTLTGMQNALYMINGVKTMLNKAILMGRLTKDPEIRYTQSGKKVASFTLAVDRGVNKATGEKEADFINCIAWEARAEFLEKYFSRGMMTIIDGRIQTRSWTAQDGSKRYATEVVAGSVQFGETKAARQRNQAAPTENDFSELEDDGDVPF